MPLLGKAGNPGVNFKALRSFSSSSGGVPVPVVIQFGNRTNFLPKEDWMMASSSHDLTQLLIAWSAGDEGALEKLTPLVYTELHRLAQHYMSGERTGHTLQTSALVNEAYLRLIDWKSVRWQNRAHFFGVCARLMRNILVDYARHRLYQKRGGDLIKVALEEAEGVALEGEIDLVALDDALQKLTKIDERKSRVIELRFFGGLSVEETAEVLQVSQETVMRDWRLARAWLLEEMGGACDEA
jgi:RNA polymerase sigma factor (TIGR02999 family)